MCSLENKHSLKIIYTSTIRDNITFGSFQILDIPGSTAYIDTKLKTANDCDLLISAFVHHLLLRADFISR